MAKLDDIIRNNRMSTRPEYYSGRGATMSDLDGQILSGIHKGIEEEYGKEAAMNFVKMVADIKVLSATTFLIELYNLLYADWKYTEKDKHADGISIPKNAEGEYDESSLVSGMAGMFAAMSNTRDQTEEIRGGFLSANGIKPKGTRRYYSNGFADYYYEED